MADSFFKDKKPAAVLKHALLERYLPVFLQKCGSRAPGGRIAYIDAYAGPGTYEDDSKGSPAVAVETARIVRRTDRVTGYFIEKDRESAEALDTYLHGEGLSWPVRRGGVEEHLPGILAEIDPRTPLFVFLDPFGLGIPIDLLAKILQRGGEMRGARRVGGAATEVLFNFTLPGLKRNAGHLTSPVVTSAYLRQRASVLRRLDLTLGGDWWRDVWTSKSSDVAADAIFDEYVDRVMGLPGNYSQGWSVPVSNQWQGRTLYYLVQLTQHPDGRWEFHQALSLAMEIYYRKCHEGQLSFETLEERSAAWVAEIRANVERLLATKGEFTVQDEMIPLFGHALGLARETHLRDALADSARYGISEPPPRGHLQHAIIRPSSTPQLF